MLQALGVFRSKSEPTTWQRQLLKALKIIRRKDLIEMVEETIDNAQ